MCALPFANLLCNDRCKYIALVVDSIADQFCAVSPNGYYADTSHCARYTECIDGQTRHLKCPDGTFFNTDISGCMLIDHQSRTVCSSRRP
jgi:hypothetical protein